jgi:hypothetical protein
MRGIERPVTDILKGRKKRSEVEESKIKTNMMKKKIRKMNESI